MRENLAILHLLFMTFHKTHYYFSSRREYNWFPELGRWDGPARGCSCGET